MVKRFLVGALILAVSLSARAQTPRPTFFEEERRLTTPSTQEISADRQTRQTKGFTETFLTDALNGIGDPGAGVESRTGLTSVDITPGNPEPPAVNFGIFVRPPVSAPSVSTPSTSSPSPGVTTSTTTLK